MVNKRKFVPSTSHTSDRLEARQQNERSCTCEIVLDGPRISLATYQFNGGNATDAARFEQHLNGVLEVINLRRVCDDSDRTPEQSVYTDVNLELVFSNDDGFNQMISLGVGVLENFIVQCLQHPNTEKRSKEPFGVLNGSCTGYIRDGMRPTNYTFVYPLHIKLTLSKGSWSVDANPGVNKTRFEKALLIALAERSPTFNCNTEGLLGSVDIDVVSRRGAFPSDLWLKYGKGFHYRDGIERVEDVVTKVCELIGQAVCKPNETFECKTLTGFVTVSAIFLPQVSKCTTIETLDPRNVWITGEQEEVSPIARLLLAKEAEQLARLISHRDSSDGPSDQHLSNPDLEGLADEIFFNEKLPRFVSAEPDSSRLDMLRSSINQLLATKIPTQVRKGIAQTLSKYLDQNVELLQGLPERQLDRDRMQEPEVQRSDRVAKIIEMLDAKPSDKSDIALQDLRALSDTFRLELAERMTPVINAKLALMPSETYAEKQQICRWLTETLRPLFLAIRSASGKPATLTASSDHSGGTFRVKESSEEGPKKFVSSSVKLPLLDLIPATPRAEGVLRKQGS